MGTKQLAPRNVQRLRLIETYRGRANRSANLFLIYSIKTDRDWIISGDRRFVHWIYYLETDAEVKSFEFKSESGRGNGRFWVVDVLLTNGTLSTHHVGRGVRETGAVIEDQTCSAANTSGVGQRIFTDEDLRPVVKQSLRWLKPIGFAAAIRDHEYPLQTLTLLDYFRQRGDGELGQILDQFDFYSYEPAVALGLVVRLSIRGHIKLDLASHSFGLRTPWILADGG